jgi:hypothetical protein
VRGYPALLDALHERVTAGSFVASPAGHVLASGAALPAEPPFARLGLAVQHAAAPGPVPDEFAEGLLELHRGLIASAVGEVMRYLGARTSGGEPLLAKQLVRAELAEVALSLSEDGARTGTDPASRWYRHQTLVRTGRRLVKLLGAAGFLAESPAADLYLAEVTGNVYLHPG